VFCSPASTTNSAAARASAHSRLYEILPIKKYVRHAEKSTLQFLPSDGAARQNLPPPLPYLLMAHLPTRPIALFAH